ncbi:MAG: hypothetical protein ABMA64_23950 [Myxococcota bacterium]
MHRLLILTGILFTLSACTSYPYVALMDGDWAGTANEQTGAAYTMVASFDYDEEEEKFPFTGQADVDGWIYGVYSAESDKEGANVEMANPLGARYLKLSAVTVEEETKMKGNFEINVCYATDPQGVGPGCLLKGNFNAEMQ